MIAVDQTIFGGERGNCYAACIASVFELDLASVPNFAASGDEWWNETRAWARGKGYTAFRIDLEGLTLEVAGEKLREWVPDALVIVAGKAERGFVHATVWRHGELVHDPHPSRAGLLDVLDATLFVPHEPRLPLAGSNLVAERLTAELGATADELARVEVAATRLLVAVEAGDQERIARAREDLRRSSPKLLLSQKARGSEQT